MVTLAGCLCGHRAHAGLRSEDSVYQRLLSFSPTSPPLKSGLHPRLEMWSDRTAAGWNQEQEAEVGVSMVAWKPSPRRPQGGAVALLRAARAGGGGEGGKYTVAEQRWKGKGRFYKFLNFMTMLQQWNVHSICCEVSTENMHWAY